MLDVAYGFSSRFRARAGGSMPTSVAATDILKIALLVDCGPGASTDISFLARPARETFMPQTCGIVCGYRRDLNGMTISAVHPSSPRRLLVSQIVFQS